MNNDLAIAILAFTIGIQVGGWNERRWWRVRKAELLQESLVAFREYLKNQHKLDEKMNSVPDEKPREKNWT